MQWFNNLTHKILSDKKLLLVVAFVFLLVYPLKFWPNARICEEGEINNFLPAKKDNSHAMMDLYFRVLYE